MKINKNLSNTGKFGLKTIAIGLLLISTVVYALPLFNPPGDPAAAGVDATNILAFTQRDFVSASGYDPADRVIVRVLHDQNRYPGATGGTTGEAATDWISPDGDLVEVNHPGGACWKTVTPDIRPGDRVQIEIMANAVHPERVGRIDETYVRNITAQRPVVVQDATAENPNGGIVEIHGTAQEDTPGGPAGQLDEALLENRLVSPGNLFTLSGKRTLRATNVAGAGEGILHYDAVDSFNWTARYTGLTSDDVKRATGADSRGMWLGNATLPAVESTIYEIGSLTFAGPAAPCTAPLEVLPPPPGSELVPPSDPTNLAATLHGQNQIDLTWTESTDNVGVTSYGVYRNGQAIFTVQNQDGSAPAPTNYSDKNIPPGTYTYHVVAFDEVGNASGPSNETAGISTTIQLGGTFPVPINDPPVLPINIIAFPSRDFISPSGYLESDKVTVQLLRKNSNGDLQIVSSADSITPDAEGFAEVNHPGGSCWEGVTPEIRVGDIVRTIALNPDNEVSTNPLGIRSIDQTTIAGVTAFKPVVIREETVPGASNDGIVEVHGSALGADGKPLPIDQIEQRMIARHGLGLFDLNNRRALRADSLGVGDGVLVYDTVNNPMGINWTATYTNLSSDDVHRIAGGISLSTGTNFSTGADTRIHWLGRDPLLLNEATIFENAPDGNPPGPAGPGCTRPLETADEVNPETPVNLNASVNANQDGITFNWTQAASPQDDWYVAGYRIFDNGVAIANAAPDATTFTLENVAPGNHIYTLRAYDTASPLDGLGDIIARISAGLGKLYGNLSAPAAVATVTGGTLGGDGGILFSDVQAPTTPGNLVAVASSNPAGGAFIDLTWDASTDNIGVVRYHVIRGSSGSGSGAEFDVAGNVLSFQDALASAGLRDYSVAACDAAGNCSVPAAATVNVPNEFDGTAPTWPVGATVTVVNPNIHIGNVTVTWSAATDNIDPNVNRYDVYRVSNAGNNDPTGAASEKITSLSGTTLSLNEVLPAGTYQYALIAVDSAGNKSVLSPLSNEIVIANDVPSAPHSLIGFPARDFISATGYTPGNTYQFTVLRNNAVVYTSQTNPADATGTIEVNHPATPPQPDTCWLVNTPNLRAGDVIRIVNTTTGIADQTTLYKVTAERPVVVGALTNAAANTVVIHGTAALENGQPVPLAQMEQRLIANRTTGQAIELYDKNGRRDLRAAAGLDGTFAYDAVNNPTGTKWTATYTGLTLNDVYRIVGGAYTDANGTKNYPGAESRAVWLGRDPLALTEATLFENGPGVTGGPSAPCITPAEPAQPATTIAGNGVFSTQTFDPLTNIGTPSPSRAMTVSNGGGAELQIGNIYISGANPGNFVRVAPPAIVPVGTPADCGTTLATGASCSVWVQFTPTKLGLHQAYLSVVGNGANTTDLSLALTGTGIEPSPPSIQFAPANVTPLTFNPTLSITQWLVALPSTYSATVNGGIVGVHTFTIKNTAVAGSRALTVSNAQFTGTNAADFTAISNCNSALQPNDTCTIRVEFRPGARAARSATLVLTHTAVANGSTTSSITVSGTGGNGSVVVAASAQTKFGTVNRGTSKNQSISVKNTGNQAAVLSLASFAVTGTGYSLVSTTCANLAVNASCSVTVRFTAPNVVNTFNGTLSITAANGIPMTTTSSLTATTK